MTSLGETLQLKRVSLGFSVAGLAEILQSESSIVYKVESNVYDSMLYFWNFRQFVQHNLILGLNPRSSLLKILGHFRFYPKLVKEYSMNLEYIGDQENKLWKSDETAPGCRKLLFSSREILSQICNLPVSRIKKIEDNFDNSLLDLNILDALVYVNHVKLLSTLLAKIDHSSFDQTDKNL